MTTGDLTLVETQWDLLVNNTMMPFINTDSNLVNWTNLVTATTYSSVCHDPPPNPEGITEGSHSCDIVDWPLNYRDGYKIGYVNTIISVFAARAMEVLAIMGEAAGAVGAVSPKELSTQAALTQAAINEV